MYRSSPTIVHAALLIATAMIACLALPSSDLATVLLPEPNDYTVDRSDVIGVCVPESVYGEPPFTADSPANMVVFKVEKPIKGCRKGEILRVLEWQSEPRYREELHRPVPTELLEKWKRDREAVPQRGTPSLLFLTRCCGDTLRQYLTYGGTAVFFEHPSEEQILLVTGWASFKLDIRLSDWKFSTSSPITVQGTLRNISQSQQTFDPGNITVTDLRTPASYPHPASAHPDGLRDSRIPPPITVPAGESRDFEWDLRDILGISGSFPGRYQVWLRVPARSMKPKGRVRLKFWIVDGLTFEDAVESCPIVFIGTVQKIHSNPDGTVKVVFAEHQHLKMIAFAGGKPFRWPQDRFPLPKEGDSLIVCVDGFDPKTRLPEILYVAKRTEELVNTVRSMLRRRPPTE